MSRSRVQLRERLRTAVETTDPAGLATYAELLRPVVENLRALAEDATAAPGKRVHSRVYLRREMLKKLREIEIRIEVAAPAPPSAS